MATSITTFSGLRCTRIARTQFFTATSTSAATETAALPVILPSFSTSTIQDTSSTSLISSTIAQQTELSTSNPTSSLTSLATTVVAASSTVTAAAATFLPAVTSLAGPSSTQSSDSNSGGSTENTSKTKVIAAAIGASLAAVAVVALVILCAYFRRRKRRTTSQIHDREKGPGTIRRFSGVTRLLDRGRPGPTTAFIPAVVGKVRPVLAGLRNFRLTTRKSHSNTPEQTQSELTERRLSVGRPIPHENPIERRDMSSAPRTMPESTDPFADSPAVNIATNRNNTRPENPFSASADPFSHTEYESETSFAMPLTIRNGHVDDDNDIADTDIDTNSINNISHHSNRSTLSGSTLNISNGRPSSPLVYQFNLRPQAWKPDRHFQDRSSTHSDPFDLERPPTIHTSAHPTPMVEEQKSQRGGYFPEMNHNDPLYSS